MEKLSSQDAGFLKIESPHCPFHVAALMVLRRPPKASRHYLRNLVGKIGRLNEAWPAYNKQLKDPADPNHAAWVPARDYQAERHVFHYALPPPGRMEDLLRLVARAHERPLDRYRPLWETHVIEGLPGDRFALYCKVHHALVDGVGAMKVIQQLFSTSPREKLDLAVLRERLEPHQRVHTLFHDIAEAARGLVQQSQALPQLSGLLAHMGVDALRGRQDAMRLPFTAPRTLFNTNIDSRRGISICELPLSTVRRLAKGQGGSINDVLLALCGGALRRYLLAQGKLPRQSLVAGLPVSLKRAGEGEGNRLSYILSPFFTNETSDLRRLQRVIEVTRDAKARLAAMSTVAAEDLYTMVMAPVILLTVTGNATRVPPVVNIIVSNVPGSRERLYMEGAELEAIYPLSIITDGMGLNITVISHVNKLCLGIASCPSEQPGIEGIGDFIKESYRALQAELRTA
jgi:diacylglycerol O-acyltransferase / wax synthase